MKVKGISVIIPSINRHQIIGKTIKTYFKALEYCGLPYEIIVIDDGSTPPYELKDVKVIRQSFSKGVCKANNLGLSKARYSHFWTCDDDMNANLDIFEKLSREEEWTKDIAAIGSTVPTINSMNLISFPRNGLRITVDGYIIDVTEVIVNEDTYLDVDFLKSGSLISKKVLKEIGGWDTQYKSGYRAETDLFLKMRYLEYRLLINPSSALFHYQYKTGGVRKVPIDIIDEFNLNQSSMEAKYFFNKWKGVSFLGKNTMIAYLRKEPILGKYNCSLVESLSLVKII